MTTEQFQELLFHVSYRQRQFAALKAKMVPSEEKLDGKNLWQGYTGTFLDSDFEDLVLPACSAKHSGHIKVELKELELEPFDRRIEREMDLQRTPHGYVRLPTATVEAWIELKSMPSAVLRTLSWYHNLTSKVDYARVAEEESKRTMKFLRALFRGDEDKLIRYARTTQEEPADVYMLVRPGDEQFDADVKDRLSRTGKPDLHHDQKMMLRTLLHFVREVLPQEQTQDPSAILNRASQLMSHMAKTQADYYRRIDKYGKRLRFAEWARLSRELGRVSRGAARKPAGIDMKSTEVFFKDLFHIFQHFWNLVIRYLKYERMQHWMAEVPNYEYGLFYVNNSVKWGGMVEVVPYAHVQTDLMLLTDEAQYVDADGWLDVVKTTNDENELKRLAGGFELGGIFSQAYESLTNREYETSVILALIGLDVAMTDALLSIEPARAHSTPGPKIPIIKEYFAGKGKLGLTDEEWKKNWNLVSNRGTKEPEGLLEIRNDVVHSGRKLPLTDAGLRQRILERMSASRLIAYRLSMWTKERRSKVPVEGTMRRGFRKNYS